MRPVLLPLMKAIKARSKKFFYQRCPDQFPSLFEGSFTAAFRASVIANISRSELHLQIADAMLRRIVPPTRRACE